MCVCVCVCVCVRACVRACVCVCVCVCVYYILILAEYQQQLLIVFVLNSTSDHSVLVSPQIIYIYHVIHMCASIHMPLQQYKYDCSIIEY